MSQTRRDKKAAKTASREASLEAHLGLSEPSNSPTAPGTPSQLVGPTNEADLQGLRVSDVFVAGRRPRFTYNPRADLRLEEQLHQYLEDRGTLLSVSGPTKSGKTTLLRSFDEGGLWLSGGAIATIEDFWQNVSDGLGDS